MRRLLCLLCLTLYSAGQESPASASAPVSERDAKAAERQFNRALRLHQADQLEAATDALDSAVTFDPLDPTYATTREYVRQQRVSRHMNRGNQLMDRGQRIEAAAEFRAALELDPTNSFAEQRFKDAAGMAVVEPVHLLQPVTFAAEPQLTPKPGKQSFDFRGTSRALIEEFARSFGLTVTFDESVSSRQLRFRLAGVEFPVAAGAVRKITKTFFIPLSPTQVLVASDTTDVRRRLERMSLRTFYVPQASSAQELQELMNVLRTMLDVRFVNANAANSTITLRAPKESLDAAERILDGLAFGRPEILLDVFAYQISDTTSRQIGVDLPLQFTVFNLATELRNLTNQPGIQDLINQLTSGGQLTEQQAAALAALLAAQQNGGSPLFQPFATFGGGITQFGLAIPATGFKLQLNESSVKVLQHATLRAQQGRAANFHVGERFPVLTSSYSPLVNIPIPPSLERANNLQPLTPSFNYEDLGITLKATPQVTGAGDVSLNFEVGIRSLSGQLFNAVPTIANRQFTGTITLKDGEASLIAGSINESEQKSLRGMPWLSRVPGLKYAVSSTSKETANSQILIVVTPRVLRSAPGQVAGSETYLSGGL
jgi:general secretion pathway protein D